MNHVPVVIGLIACDLAIVDEKTRNLTPVNCFGARRLKQFPGSADFNVVAWLADGLGTMPVKVVIEKLATSEEIYRAESVLKFDDALRDKYFVARIRDCEFPEAGQYVISLFVDDEFVAHRKIRVHE